MVLRNYLPQKEPTPDQTAERSSILPSQEGTVVLDGFKSPPWRGAPSILGGVGAMSKVLD